MDIYSILGLPRDTKAQALAHDYAILCEVYRLVAEYGDSPILAQQRLDALISAGTQAGLEADPKPAKHDPDGSEEVYSILCELNSSKLTGNNAECSRLFKRIDSLDECAVKYYLSALVFLAHRQDPDNMKNAVGELAHAIKLDPDNPAYTALLDGIESELDRLDIEARRMMAQAELERARREADSAEEIDNLRRRR